MPTPVARNYVTGERGLRQLAVESLLDGVICEGMAAERARLGAEKARDASFARAQRRIYVDESRHAALGGDIALWAARVGGDSVRDALADSRSYEPGDARDDACEVEASGYGLVGAQDANGVAERMARGLPARVERLLEG